MSSDSPRALGRLGLRVAISGKSGCGNTTVSRLVAAALGLRVVNYTFKSIAQERGMTFEEVCLLAESDSQFDLAVDRRQVQLAEEGGCVLGSRLAIWLLKESAFTVYLEASLPVRAGRIARREGLFQRLVEHFVFGHELAFPSLLIPLHCGLTPLSAPWKRAAGSSVRR